MAGEDDNLDPTSQGTFMGNVYATATSQFMLDLKELVKQLDKVIVHEVEVGKKLSQKSASTLKEIHMRMFHRCMEAEAEHIKTKELYHALTKTNREREDQFNRIESGIRDQGSL